MSFEITELRNNTVWQLYRMRNRIQLDPEYQRQSEIWTPDKRQTLLDTILNGFDVPKLYLHKFPKTTNIKGKPCDFAIVDGKQRLETIWSFLDGHLALADDFSFFKSDKVSASGMKYEELGQKYPELKADFDGFPLAVMCIETDDIEMIEEMFSRLNEAMPLSAAEKRNAYGGPVPVAVRKLSKLSFFTRSVPFPNRRYRHFDIVAKFLLAEHEGKVVDTKKVYLDSFAKSFREKSRTKMPAFVGVTLKTINHMSTVFSEKDSLLRQVGMVTLYYHLFRVARNQNWEERELTRKKLLDFEKLREANRIAAEKDLATADYDLIEFDRYAQSPNDGYAMKFRLRVMLERIFKRKVKADDL